MRRLRQAAWAALLAGLGLLSGCQSCDPCTGGRPSLMSRLGFRPRSQVVYEGPIGTAVSSGAHIGGGYPITSGLPISSFGGGDCCEGTGLGGLPPSPFYSGGSEITGGPILDAPFHSNGGGIPLHSNAGPILQPRNGVPAMPPAMNTLPPPTVIPGEPRLAPVPGGGLAQPTPATPSSRRR